MVLAHGRGGAILQTHLIDRLDAILPNVNDACVGNRLGTLIHAAEQHFPDTIPPEERIPLLVGPGLVAGGLTAPVNLLHCQLMQLVSTATEPTGKIEMQRDVASKTGHALPNRGTIITDLRPLPVVGPGTFLARILFHRFIPDW
jgi:hypothetical protein